MESCFSVNFWRVFFEETKHSSDIQALNKAIVENDYSAYRDFFKFPWKFCSL